MSTRAAATQRPGSGRGIAPPGLREAPRRRGQARIEPVEAGAPARLAYYSLADMTIRARQPTAAPADRAGPTPLPSFPHAEDIGRQLGRPLAAGAILDAKRCGEKGVPAFTERGSAHFASPNPPLRVAAHEAAHVLQHEGATRDMGAGAERHADAVARAVAAGRDAGPLLGNHGARVVPGMHLYTEIDTPAQSAAEWDAKMKLRVSEDGLMAVGQDKTMHSFWADSSKVAESNKTLDALKSVIRLEAQSDSIVGSAPNGKGSRTLPKVLPKNVSNSTTGENMNIWADCGKSARDVMGAGEGTGWHGDKMAAVYTVPVKLPDSPAWYKPWGWNAKPEGPYKQTAASAPDSMKEEILKEKLGAASGGDALSRYEAMSPADRDKLDLQSGINKYALPTTGEGYTMSSGGANVPGKKTWNFHWAGVVMAIGADRVTLENYSVSKPAVQNSDWEFQMYGSARKAGQTFYEQHKATGQHGEIPIAMRVRKRE